MVAQPLIAANVPAAVAKREKIIKVLMDQVERGMDVQGSAYSLFQTAIVLEDKVRERTQTLQAALRELEKTNRELAAAKTQIELAQTRLMEAIDTISEGFVHFNADDRLVLCNRNFLEFWPGLERMVQPGVTFRELSRWVVEAGLIVDAESDREGWLTDRLRRHCAPAEPMVVRLVSGQWLQISERVLPDGGTVGIYTDISEIKLREQRQREQELAEKSILLQSTLDNLVQGVSVFDENLQLVAWNGPFRELLNLPDWLVVPGAAFEDIVRFRGERGDYGSDADGAMAVRIESARQARRLHTEQTFASGQVLEVRRDPMPNGGFVATYTDVTERRAAAAAVNEAKNTLERRVAERTAELTNVNLKLRDEIAERARIEEALKLAKAEADKANLGKTRFIAAASHDLLQPLNAARLFVTALSERPLEAKENELAQRIDVSLQTVEGLLGALLDISKLDAGAIPVEIRDFRVSTVLQMLRAEYEAIAAASHVELRLVASSAVVRTDPNLLGRILRNLLSNAVRYTPEGKVLLGCRRRGDMLRIETWDTGIGIPREHLEDIFDEFRQLKTPQRDIQKSFGLGLAIVMRIARTLDHPISVRSELGRGSVFAVDIPISWSSADAEGCELPRAEVPDSISGATVVVVENEAEILVGMRELLQGWGCRVVVGVSGKTATAALRRSGRRPDIVVADYHLEDRENGMDAVERIRVFSGNRVPALMITADSCPELHERIRKQGLHALKKPLKPAKLRALMSHLLAGPSA